MPSSSRPHLTEGFVEAPHVVIAEEDAGDHLAVDPAEDVNTSERSDESGESESSDAGEALFTPSLCSQRYQVVLQLLATHNITSGTGQPVGLFRADVEMI